MGPPAIRKDAAGFGDSCSAQRLVTQKVKVSGDAVTGPAHRGMRLDPLIPPSQPQVERECASPCSRGGDRSTRRSHSGAERLDLGTEFTHEVFVVDLLVGEPLSTVVVLDLSRRVRGGEL
jgi:hypothetical protein